MKAQRARGDVSARDDFAVHRNGHARADDVAFGAISYNAANLHGEIAQVLEPDVFGHVRLLPTIALTNHWTGELSH
jgi:hypothetical protein